MNATSTTNENENANAQTTQQLSGSRDDSQTLGATARGLTGGAGNDDAVSGEFDAESLEISFGLPPGSLKDVKDEVSAMAAVRDMTDKTLLAGLGLGHNMGATAGQTPETAQTKTAAESVGKQTDAAVTAHAALLERIESLESQVTEHAKHQEQRTLAEIDRRLLSEVDDWASTKYGVSGTRTYAQMKSLRELRDELIPHYVGGARAAGLGVPTIEIVARRLRAHTDETYKPAMKKEDKSGAMGTPGARRESGGADAPRSIHEALLRNAS